MARAKAVKKLAGKTGRKVASGPGKVSSSKTRPRKPAVKTPPSPVTNKPAPAVPAVPVPAATAPGEVATPAAPATSKPSGT